MLIREMAFVFHKSKQVEKRVTIKKLSKTINITEVSFSSNEQFCGEGYVQFRSHDSGPTIQAERNLLV